MRLHCLQHVSFEGLANIDPWARRRDFSISCTRLFMNENLPEIADFDWLVVMGGPMNIYETDSYPWLVHEKKFIADAIRNDRIVLGVCLGAQLIADVLGGSVFKNHAKEIGWHPVFLAGEASDSPVFSSLPQRFTAFHWHGDTFHLPPGARKLARSEACSLQAFEYNDGRVIGLQFHLESSPESVRLLIENCGDELVEGKYIQSTDEILAKREAYHEVNGLMTLILDNLANR